MYNKKRNLLIVTCLCFISLIKVLWVFCWVFVIVKKMIIMPQFIIFVRLDEGFWAPDICSDRRHCSGPLTACLTIANLIIPNYNPSAVGPFPTKLTQLTISRQSSGLSWRLRMRGFECKIVFLLLSAWHHCRLLCSTYEWRPSMHRRRRMRKSGTD